MLIFHNFQGLPYYLIYDGAILLRRIQKHYGWNSINIMGHSLGGIIGFLFAAIYPNDVNTLISLDVVAPIFQFSNTNFVSQMGGMIDK